MSKLTIVTIAFNNLEGLKKTVESFKSQRSPDKRMIIIDGRSTDGTLEWLQEQKVEGLVYISEKDKGISDAFNKGILASKSEWVCFLNSGDVLLHEEIFDFFLHNINTYTDTNTNMITFQAITQLTEKVFPVSINMESVESRSMLSHQASLMRTQAFFDLGFYDLNFKLRMDYVAFLKFNRHHPPVFIKNQVVGYDVFGRSSKLTNRPRFIAEGAIAEYLLLGKPTSHLLKIIPQIAKDITKKVISYSYYLIRYRINLF